MNGILSSDHSKGVCWCLISAVGVKWPTSGERAGEETAVGSIEKESERCILESMQFMAVRLEFLVPARHVLPCVPYCRLSQAKLSPVFGNYFGLVATMKILISPIRKSIEPEECGLTAWEGKGRGVQE